MKRNDSGNFCILYIEPGDDRATLLRTIIGQQKHIVLMLAEQSKLFQRPEEFVALKHIKRQLDVSIFFVVAHGELVTQLAGRNGFSVYRSMDALNEDMRSRASTRLTPTPESRPAPIPISSHSLRRTVPLTPFEEDIAYTPTRPVAVLHSFAQKREVSREDVGATPCARPSSPEMISSGRAQGVAPTSSLSVQSAQTAIADKPTRPDMHQRPAALPMTPPPSPAVSPAPSIPTMMRPKKKAPRLPAIMIALLILALSAAGLASLLVYYHAPVASDASTAVIVGHVYFLSSGQVNESTNQGIDDEVQVDLRNLSNPAAGKKYYAWLLSDKKQSETQAILLGVLQVNKGVGQLFYSGDASHTNLLAITSRFLVTEEDGSVMPMAPSPNNNTWRYYGEFLQVPIQSSNSKMAGMSGMEGQYSFLDHLRHLLAADPMLDQNELPGGLNNWFSLNTQKVLEWSSSMRETWEQSKDVGFVRRQTVRSLTYLDGLSYVSRDIPPGTPPDLNDRLARIGLLSVNGPNQDPPSYLDSIVFHLNGLMLAGGSTPALRNNAAAILTAMNNVRYWLGQVRKDGQQIMKMTDAQLLAPSTLALINDMIANASNAYAGEIDPSTNQMREGVTWIHDHMQTLATLDIAPYAVHSSPVQMIPSLKAPWMAWFGWKGQV